MMSLQWHEEVFDRDGGIHKHRTIGILNHPQSTIVSFFTGSGVPHDTSPRYSARPGHSVHTNHRFLKYKDDYTTIQSRNHSAKYTPAPQPSSQPPTPRPTQAYTTPRAIPLRVLSPTSANMAPGSSSLQAHSLPRLQSQRIPLADSVDTRRMAALAYVQYIPAPYRQGNSA